ncbi:MAG: hypothetical protein Q8J89_11050 [Caulobacter sp.]|nr:hypothetical protein [Caulobacter sp.]
MKPLHTVAFYALADRLGDGPSKPWWAARLVEGEIGPAAARWADSRTCQALEAALGEMTRLPVNGLTIGGMRPPGPAPRYVADGEAYTVWSRAGLQSDGSPVAVTVSSNGGDLAVWVEATLARLEPCWTDVPPPAPAR